MTDADRIRINREAWTRRAASGPGIRLRRFEAFDLELSLQLGLRLFDGEARVAQPPTPAEHRIEMYAFGYLLAVDSATAEAAAALGWEPFRDELLKPWLRTLTPPALGVIVAELAATLAEMEAGTVNPKSAAPSCDGDGEPAPPNT